jgi:hypothetical protein
VVRVVRNFDVRLVINEKRNTLYSDIKTHVFDRIHMIYMITPRQPVRDLHKP